MKTLTENRNQILDNNVHIKTKFEPSSINHQVTSQLFLFPNLSHRDLVGIGHRSLLAITYMWLTGTVGHGDEVGATGGREGASRPFHTSYLAP